MKSWRAWIAGLATVMLAGCGGGGDGGTPILGPTTPTPTASDLVLVLSDSTVVNTGIVTVDATVTAVDKNNNAIANVPVTLSVNANATISIADNSTKTGSDGKLKGTVSIGSDKSLRTITVTAVSGSLTKTASLQVIDGSTNGAPKAADLTLALSSPTLQNSGTQTVTVTATAVDANRNTVANIPVTLAVDNGATIKVGAAVTNADGKVTGDISIGDDKTNRVVSVVATSGTLSRKAALQITGSQIKATLLPAVLSAGQTGKIQYKLLDFSGNPVPQKAVTIVSNPGGVQSAGTSDLNGDFEYVYTAPAIGGVLSIKASAIGVESVSSVLVQGGGLPGVTTKVQSASVSASPSVVPVNTPNTKNQAAIRALFLGALNAPIANIRVRFDLDGDKQSIGGTFTSGSTMVYSDANGVAATAYVPGSRFSPTDGVTVRACWDYNDFAEGTCPNSTKTTLTVISDSLSVTIGTNDLISEDETKLKYVNRFVVQVVDSSGLAAPDVQVSVSVDLLQYLKGVYVLGLNSQGRQLWLQQVAANCDNEDLNRNGVAEVFSNGAVEDANNSFNLTAGRPALEPRKADVAVSFEGSSKTDSNGVVVVKIEYPKNVASWDIYNLVVTASGVAGTEGRANYVAQLSVPAEVINKFDTAPPFIVSPYGVQTSPTVEAKEPGSTRPAAMLCTNPN